MTRDLLYSPSLLSLPFLSLFLSHSLCFPLPKLRAIMNASIFYLVPSARPYCSRLPSFPSATKLSLFSRAIFFLPTPFTRYRPFANGTRLPFAFIRSGVPASDQRACGLCPYPRPLPSAIVPPTRASPSWRFIPRDADRHSTFSLLSTNIRSATLRN